MNLIFGINTECNVDFSQEKEIINMPYCCCALLPKEDVPGNACFHIFLSVLSPFSFVLILGNIYLKEIRFHFYISEFFLITNKLINIAKPVFEVYYKRFRFNVCGFLTLITLFCFVTKFRSFTLQPS